MPTVISPGEDSDRSGGVGGAPPLRSIAAATVPHYFPLCNTTPHFSVRWAVVVAKGSRVFGSVAGKSSGKGRWDDGCVWARFLLPPALLNAIARAKPALGGPCCRPAGPGWALSVSVSQRKAPHPGGSGWDYRGRAPAPPSSSADASAAATSSRT